MNWTKLSKIAFLGTDRAGLNDLSQKELDDLKLSKDGEPAELLLKATVLSRTQQRAGHAPQLITSVTPSSSSSIRGLISSRALLYFEKMVEGEYQKALPEFLDLCFHTRQKLPAYSILDLLELVDTRVLPSFKSIYYELIPENAWALLQAHPKWKNWAVGASPEYWNSSDEYKKLQYFTKLRIQAPRTAAALLSQNWHTLSDFAKKVFLIRMNRNLSYDDQKFLDHNMETENSSGILYSNSSLLLKLPDTPLSIQLYHYVFQHINEKEDGTLSVVLPEAPDPYWLKISAQENRKKHDYQSQRANLLAELIEKLHPSFWNTYLNLPPEDCLPVLEASEEADTLIRGLVKAVGKNEDHEWADAMTARLFSKKTGFEQLYAMVKGSTSEEGFNRILSRHLKNQAFLVEDKSEAYNMLQACRHPWSNELSLAILEPFQQWLASARSAQWQTWHYKIILEMAAYRANPNLVGKLAPGWQFQSYLGIQWQENIDQLNKTLNFRKGMRKAVLENSKKQ